MAQITPKKSKVLTKFRSLDMESRLRSYRYPSALEETQLSELISEAGHEMNRLDTEMVRLHQAMLAIQNEKRELERRVLQCKSLFAPIRKLPPEVLSQIFLHHSKTNDLILPGHIPAMEIACVCSHWHSVLVQPMFWSRITLDLNGDISPFVQSSLLKNVLSRSGDRDLSITLSRQEEDVLDALRTNAAVNVLMEQSHRWVALQLKLPIRTLNRVLQNLRGRIPHLESLEITLPDLSGVPLTIVNPIFENAPALRSVKLDRLCAPNIALPWDQLTHLQYTFVDPSALTATLRVCTNIQTLVIDSFFDFDIAIQPATVPSLKTLAIGIDGAGTLEDVLTLLTTPNLDTLSLSSNRSPTGQNLRWLSDDNISVTRLVSRSSCTITSLSFRDIELEEAELIELCRRIPTISSLSLHKPGVGDEGWTPISAEFLRLMDPYGVSHSVLLPRLTNLYIHSDIESGDNAAPQLPQDMLMDVIHARWQPDSPEQGRVACIRVVDLVLHDCPKPVMDIARYLKQAGLRISLASFSSSGTKTYI